MRKELEKEKRKRSEVFWGLKSPPDGDYIAFSSRLPERD